MASMNLSLIVDLVNNTQAGARKIKDTLQDIREGASQGLRDSLVPAFSSDQFDKNISKLDNRVNEARGKLLGAAAMLTSVLAPVKLAANFDQSFRGVQKVLNDVPTEKVKELRKFLLETSSQMPLSAANLSELMASAIQFGIPVDEVKGFTVFTAKAAVAFDMAAGEIGRVMAKLRNVYKLNQDGVIDLADATNHLANNMAAEASEILDFANRAASASNVLKMSAVEMSAIGAAMIAAGIQPEVAARGMNAMSNNILAGGKKVETGFKQLGISRQAFMKRMKEDGAGAFLELMTAASKSKKGMEALINIVGKDFADDFGKLIANMELFETSFGLLDEDRSGSVNEEYLALANGANEQWKLLLNKLARAGIILGNQLLPHMVQLGETIGWAVDKFAAFSEANPELVGWLVQGTAALLLFGAATRLIGFAWAVASRGLFGFLGLFLRFNKAGKNISMMARAARGLVQALRGIKAVSWVSLILPIRWVALAGKLSWRLLIPVLKWGAFLMPIKWAAIAGKLSWRLLIPVLKWGARFIPFIGWAALAGMLAWDMLIKPLGWDKYLNLGALKSGLDKARNWIASVFGVDPKAQVKDREKNPEDYVKTARGWRKKSSVPSDASKEPAPNNAATRRKQRRSLNAPPPPPVYDPAQAGKSGSQVQQKIDAQIKASVIDKRPPNVHVNAPITINEATNASAVAAAVRGQLSAAVSGGKGGALHDGVD